MSFSLLALGLELMPWAQKGTESYSQFLKYIFKGMKFKYS